MDIYASDEEKGEEIKRWWRENGWSIIAYVALGIAAVVGGRYWLAQQQVAALTASSIYQQTIVELEQGNHDQASTAADKLISEFASTPYAVFSALEMAKHSVANNELSQAKHYLEWVLANAELTGQREIARLRLAQVLLAEQQYDAALARIQETNNEAFKSLFDELKGDIYLAQGKIAEAATAYRAAMVGLDDNQPREIILKLKLDDIAGS